MTVRIFFPTAATVISLALGGCSLSPSVAPSPTTTEPSTLVYLPEGDAQDNKVLFDQVLSEVATMDQTQPGRTMVNALVNAGFRKASIQVTEDETKTMLPADSVIVAVRINRSCLIGQRTQDKGYFSSIESALKTGGCLIGTTREIDW